MPQEWYADGVATCSHRQVSAGIETGLDTTATLKKVTFSVEDTYGNGSLVFLKIVFRIYSV